MHKSLITLNLQVIYQHDEETLKEEDYHRISKQVIAGMMGVCDLNRTDAGVLFGMTPYHQTSNVDVAMQILNHPPPNATIH